MRRLVLGYTGPIDHRPFSVWKALRSLVFVYTGPMCHNVVLYLQEDAQACLVLHWSLNVKRPFSIWSVMHRQV